MEGVQHRVTRQPSGEQGGARPDDDAGLSAELVAVVAGARRRAVRDGDRQIDTAHLLHSLLDADAEAYAVLEADPQLPRLLGYFSSYSATKRCREATGQDPVAAHAPAFAAAWGDPASARTMRWPMFVHARRKPTS